MSFTHEDRLRRRAYRDRRTAGLASARLVLARTRLPNEAGDSSHVPVDLDGSGTGVVPSDRWWKRERHAEDGSISAVEVCVVAGGICTRAKLAEVGAYAIQFRDAASGLWSGDLHRAKPAGGIAHTADEAAVRWESAGIIEEAWSPDAAPLELAPGDVLVLD